MEAPVRDLPIPPRRPSRRVARPRRGLPAETRDRLVAAAAEVFNRDGYHGTDSNRLARAAGYAPATFYKHFPDKRAILLAAYEAWVGTEWQAIGTALRQASTPTERAARIVDLVLAHHRRWRGLRASLRALVATDPVARAFHRAQRRRQLDTLSTLRGGDDRSGPSARGRRADDTILLFTLERTLDAVAEGEVAALGLAIAPIVARLRDMVQRSFNASSKRGSRSAARSARGEPRGL